MIPQDRGEGVNINELMYVCDGWTTRVVRIHSVGKQFGLFYVNIVIEGGFLFRFPLRVAVWVRKNCGWMLDAVG